MLEVQWVPCTAAVAAEGGSVLQGIPVVSGVGWKVNIQLLTSDYIRLLNKPIENEVTLRVQSPS